MVLLIGVPKNKADPSLRLPRFAGPQTCSVQDDNSFRVWAETQEGMGLLPALLVFARFCRNPAAWCLERLNVRSLPTLGPLHHVELHGLTFLQALETTRGDCGVVPEDIFAVLTRNKANTLRVIEPLPSTLFHFVLVS